MQKIRNYLDLTVFFTIYPHQNIHIIPLYIFGIQQQYIDFRSRQDKKSCSLANFPKSTFPKAEKYVMSHFPFSFHQLSTTRLTTPETSYLISSLLKAVWTYIC